MVAVVSNHFKEGTERMRKRKILDLSLSEFCSWPEAGLLHPALLSSLKSVQAPAVGPGIPRQGQGRARVRPEGRVRTAQPSSSLLGSVVRGQGCSWQLGASVGGERTCVHMEERVNTGLA